MGRTNPRFALNGSEILSLCEWITTVVKYVFDGSVIGNSSIVSAL